MTDLVVDYETTRPDLRNYCDEEAASVVRKLKESQKYTSSYRFADEDKAALERILAKYG